MSIFTSIFINYIIFFFLSNFERWFKYLKKRPFTYSNFTFLLKYYMLLILLICFNLFKKHKDEIDGDFDISKQISKLSEKMKNCSKSFNYDFEKLNIIILGKPGVGKSTLINNIFRGNFTDTGIGMPVTNEIKQFSQKNFPLALFDTPGVELEHKKQKKLFNDIYNIIKDRYSTKNPHEFIHYIWYCINVNSNRFEEKEFYFIKELSRNQIWGDIPVFLILTQCNSIEDSNKIIEEIKKEELDIEYIIPILAEKKNIKMPNLDKTLELTAFGIDKLIEALENHFPDMIKIAHTNNQVFNQYSFLEKIIWYVKRFFKNMFK